MNEPDANELARLRNGKIFVAGHRGLVGRAIVRKLEDRGCENLLLLGRSELDLTDPGQVSEMFRAEQPDFVFVAAAKVGGINANNVYPADFIYENLMIAANVISASHASNVDRLLFLGSSCIYPRLADQPMSESCLLTGLLEPTNEPYAIAKIAGIKLCESFNRQHQTDYRSVMPTNLYGPHDNFNPETSHVIPALIRKFHEAKLAGASSVEIWGTGKPRREFLHVDDLADACLFVMCLPVNRYQKQTEPMLSHLNVGCGKDVTISELAELVGEVVGYEGDIEFNADYPDGAPRKLLDVSALSALGWDSKIDLRAGLTSSYEWYSAELT